MASTRQAVILLLALMVVGPCGRAAERAIAVIRTRYAIINQNLHRYTQIRGGLEGYSTEGGTFIAYFSKSSPRKIGARFYGETGRSTEEYYFWNNRLIFVVRVESRSDKPFGKIQRTTEDRFYFSNGQLIQWIDARREHVPVTSRRAQQRRHELLQGARELLASAKANRRR